MKQLLLLIRCLLLPAGIAGMLVSAWAFLDPSAFPALGEAHGMLGRPPSPRWRAAFAFMVSLAVAASGAGLLRHRSLP